MNVRLILNQRANATVVPTAAVSNGTQGAYVFVVNPGPTPADKLKNLPTTLQRAATSPTPNSGPQYHADNVLVHVDYAIGTNSVLSDGVLKSGQKLVVDGQEKLVDGSMVSPQLQAGGAGGGSK